MIKSYRLQDGTEFKTITIPKGTVLFRGIRFEEGDRFEKLFSELVGYKSVREDPQGLDISPTMNVFFYPSPYVSQCIDKFNVHIIYLTNYDLELFLMIKPSLHHRGMREDEENPITSLIKKCDQISEIDKCGFKMKEEDACFTDKILEIFPHILGYIAIASTDKDKFLVQYKKFIKHRSYEKIFQILPCVSSDSRDYIGIPEIVLYPLHQRRNTCVNLRRYMYGNEKIVKYCIQNRAQFNYFPLLYITKNARYTFDDLEYEKNIDCIRKTAEEPIQEEYTGYNKHLFINEKLFKILHRLLNRFLSPAGILINNILYKFSNDTRTGFYIVSTEYSKIQNTNNKTRRNANGKLRIVNFHTDIETVIPYSYSKQNKKKIRLAIGTGKSYNDFEHYSGELNANGMEFTTNYVLDKGQPEKYSKILQIEKVLERPDIGKKKRLETRKNRSPRNQNITYSSLEEISIENTPIAPSRLNKN